MPTECYICKKQLSFGHNVSHANKKSKRRWNPNLQTVKIKKGGTTLRVRVCARCIRNGAVVKAA